MSEDPFRRVVLVFDGLRWHVRRLRQSEHDLERDEMVYRCDKPIANDIPALDEAARVARAYITGKT